MPSRTAALPADRISQPAEAPRPVTTLRPANVVGIDAGGHRQLIHARRDELAAEHIGMVRPIAKRLKAILPPGFDLEDLVQTGMVGLLAAAMRYRPEAFPDVPFRQYAKHGIRGAILDSVRGRKYDDATLDPLPEAYEERGYEPELDEEIDRRREIARVLDAVEYLDPRTRQIVASYYQDGATLESAGRTVGLGISQTWDLKVDAIAELRRILHVH
jgi:RNA polymerase sigma factor (sigma-70 family)